MKNKKVFLRWLAIMVVLFAFLGIFYACGSLMPFYPSVNTDLTSSRFSAALSAAGVISATGTAEGGFWKLTPNKITGKVASVLFPIANTVDEGAVVYGSYRPDLLKANADLYDFDLSEITRLSGNISKRPDYKGGKAPVILMLYGYFNVYFTHSNTEEVIRFAYGSSSPYTKGDVLLKNKTTGAFEWLDKDTNTFVATRPANAYVIEMIATFTDPQHPSSTYYFPLAARITSPSDGVDLPASLLDNNNLTFTVDFDYTNALLFDLDPPITSQTDFDSRSLEALVSGVDLSQNRSEWGVVATTTEASSIITCTVTVEATPVKGGT